MIGIGMPMRHSNRPRPIFSLLSCFTLNVALCVKSRVPKLASMGISTASRSPPGRDRHGRSQTSCVPTARGEVLFFESRKTNSGRFGHMGLIHIPPTLPNCPRVARFDLNDGMGVGFGLYYRSCPTAGVAPMSPADAQGSPLPVSRIIC